MITEIERTRDTYVPDRHRNSSVKRQPWPSYAAVNRVDAPATKTSVSLDLSTLGTKDETARLSVCIHNPRRKRISRGKLGTGIGLFIYWENWIGLRETGIWE